MFQCLCKNIQPKSKNLSICRFIFGLHVLCGKGNFYQKKDFCVIVLVAPSFSPFILLSKLLLVHYCEHLLFLLDYHQYTSVTVNWSANMSGCFEGIITRVQETLEDIEKRNNITSVVSGILVT